MNGSEAEGTKRAAGAETTVVPPEPTRVRTGPAHDVLVDFTDRPPWLPHSPVDDRQRIRRMVDKRLRPLYLTSFVQGFALWYAVEKLFLHSIGFGDSLITITASIYFTVMAVVNVPIGVLADRWSRKGVLHLATAGLIASSVICGLSTSFWTYAAGTAVFGIFYSCQTGTFDAIVYDTVVEHNGSPDGFERHFGKVQMAEFLGIAGGSLASIGIVQLLSLRATYFLTVPITCLAFVSLHPFHEPRLHHTEDVLLSAHLGQIVRAFRHRWDLAWIVVAIVCAGVVMRVLFEFGQLWYLGLRLPSYWYGPCNALLLSGAAAGGYLASKLRLNRSGALAIGLCTLAGTAGLFYQSPPAVIASQLVTMAGITLLTVILTRYLHDEMPSNIRTGASSVAGAVGYAIFVPVAIAFGLASQGHGIFQASWVLTAALVGACVALIVLVLPAGQRGSAHQAPE